MVTAELDMTMRLTRRLMMKLKMRLMMRLERKVEIHLSLKICLSPKRRNRAFLYLELEWPLLN